MPSSEQEAPDDEPEAPDEDQTEDETAEADEDGADESDDEQPDDEDGDETDDEDSEDEGDEQPDKLKVTVDGQEVEVTLDDLKRSYSGQAYIQKRMQEVANNKKEVEAVYQALAQERAQVAQFVQQAQQGIPQEPQMPDKALAQKDPAQFNAQMAQYMQDRERYDQFMTQTQQLTAQQSEAQQRAMQAQLAQEAERLKQEIPEFADPEKGGELRKKLVQTGADYGFSEDELAGITDARTVKVLHDAYRWRQLQTGKEKATQKAGKARPVVKPGAKRGQNQKQTERQQKMKRLQKTGRVDDAIDLLFE